MQIGYHLSGEELQGELAQILPLPAHFEEATANVTEAVVAEAILCDQHAGAHIERLREAVLPEFTAVRSA